MEKTIEIQLAEQRESIARELEALFVHYDRSGVEFSPFMADMVVKIVRGRA